MKVILLGYMGVGKTSIAKKIEKKTGIPAYDLDNLIEINQNSSIDSIFSEKGEVYFRKLESSILNDFVNTNNEFILSLGGGTPCYANNHELLQQQDVISIYLKASIPLLVERLIHKTSKRPLIKDLKKDELEDYIRKHLFDRSFYYHQAKHIVETDQLTKSEIIKKILPLLL